MTKVIIQCPDCLSERLVSPQRKKDATAKGSLRCSKCGGKQAAQSPNFKLRILPPWNKGQSPSPELLARQIAGRIGKYPKGEKNYQWKGDDAGYFALHIWMKTNYGNPKECEECGKVGEKVGRAWNIHWANITDQYLRKREDWRGLCVKCHSRFDHDKKK